jgi:hypothetical protein
MAIDNQTDISLDRRWRGGNYYGVERRRNLGQGAFVMATVHRWTLYGILAFNMVLAASVLNLTYFAKQGPRYTAEDGAREKAERIQADKDLTARIDSLYLSNFTD